MADVLELVGIPKFTGATKSGGKHVEFVSVDRCKVQAWILNHCFVVIPLVLKCFLVDK